MVPLTRSFLAFKQDFLGQSLSKDLEVLLGRRGIYGLVNVRSRGAARLVLVSDRCLCVVVAQQVATREAGRPLDPEGIKTLFQPCGERGDVVGVGDLDGASVAI